MSRRFIIRAKPYELPSVCDGKPVGVAQIIPVGHIFELRAGESVPEGWLLCDGGAYDPDAYPELREVLRDGYGVGLLPDLA